MPGSEYEFEDAIEDSPFLAGQETGADEEAQPQDVKPPIHAAWYQVRTSRSIIALIALIMFLLVFSACLALIPMARLLEDTLCRRYYDTTEPVEESRCKVDEVQAELAWLGGLGPVIHSIVGMSRPFCSIGFCDVS